MKSKKLEHTFEKYFHYLEGEHGFKTMLSERKEWRYCFIAMNLTTGIEIIYEFKEAYIQVILHKLINGEILHSITNSIKNNTPITGFSLEWILALRNPKEQIKPAYNYPPNHQYYKKDGLEKYVAMVAEKLKEYASDILNGDFSVFTTLDSMVKENYHNYYKNKN